jgi:FkbM family methyltransferase
MSEFAADDRSFFLGLNRTGQLPSVVYDIGAAAGSWSAVVTADLPITACHLFEPLADTAHYRQSLDNNLKDNPRWRLHPIALSVSNAEMVTMRTGRGDNIFGSTILDIEDENFDRAEVRQWRLDDYAAEQNLPPPDFVKIDTQASERLVLLGGFGVISKASAMVIETSLYHNYGPKTPLLGDIIELTVAMGFVVFGFGDHWRDKHGVMQQIDTYFVKPDVALALKSA